MGLGKTLQVIGDHHIDLCYHFIIFNFCYMTTCKLGCAALFCHLYEMGISGPFLVVAPLSTIPNWLNEFKRFAPKVFLCNQSWGSVFRIRRIRKLLDLPCPSLFTLMWVRI